MKKSVNKKRSQVGRRVIAFAFTLLLLVSVLAVPASAVESPGDYSEENLFLGGTDCWKDIDYVYGSDGQYRDGLPQRLWMSNPDVYLPMYTAADPLCVRYSDVEVSWNPTNWTYVSFEIASFQDGSHWSVGFWERTGGTGAREVVYRLMYYDATSSDKNITVFEKVLPEVTTANPVITTEYWTEDGATMCRVFFDVQMDMHDCSYSFRIDTPFQIRVKTEYAGLYYKCTIGDVRYQSGYNAGEQDGYEEGYGEGEEYGHTWGYVSGWGSGAQAMFDSFKEYYTEAGGPELVDGMHLTNREAILNYFKDLGWTECANQGALTMQLIYTALEAPLNVILGGLDFSVFGINLAETIFAVLSIIVIFAIVRIVLAILPLV